MMKRMVVLLLFGLVACGPTGVGRDCEYDEDCRAIPGGYCVRAGICVAPCVEAGAACDGSDGTCADVGSLICLQACEDDCECGTGESCVERACVITNPLEKP